MEQRISVQWTASGRHITDFKVVEGYNMAFQGPWASAAEFVGTHHLVWWNLNQSIVGSWYDGILVPCLSAPPYTVEESYLLKQIRNHDIRQGGLFVLLHRAEMGGVRFCPHCKVGVPLWENPQVKNYIPLPEDMAAVQDEVEEELAHAYGVGRDGWVYEIDRDFDADTNPTFWQLLWRRDFRGAREHIQRWWWARDSHKKEEK